MRILVTGSRELTDRLLVWNALSRFAPARMITVVCGYDTEREIPTGADQFAYQWANSKSRPWAEPECHPANWDRECDSNCFHKPRFRVEIVDGTEVLVPYCPVAGNIRNTEMVESGADYFLGFYKYGAKNRGTRDCVRKAREAGIPGDIVWEMK